VNDMTTWQVPCSCYSNPTGRYRP